MKKVFLLSCLIIISACNNNNTVKPSNNNANTSYNFVAQVNNYYASNYVNAKWKTNAKATIINGHLELDATWGDTGKLAINIYDFKPGTYQFGGIQYFKAISNNKATFKPNLRIGIYTDNGLALPHDTFVIGSLDTIQKTISGSFSIFVEGSSDSYHFKGTFTNVKYTGSVPVLQPSFSCQVGNVNRVSDSASFADYDYDHHLIIVSDSKDYSSLEFTLPDSSDIGTFNITESGPNTSYFMSSIKSTIPNEEFYGVSGSLTISLHTLSCVQGTYKTGVQGLNDPTPKRSITGSFTVFF